MATSYLQRLLGLAIDGVIPHDFGSGLSLQLGAEWRLALYNRFEYRHPAGPSTPLDTLLGALVLRASEDACAATLWFDGDRELVIDLSDAAYRGPEVMQLKGPDDLIVIWN